MKTLHTALIASMLALPVHSLAQSSSVDPATAQEPAVSSGAIIIPPATDPGMVKPAPSNVDPGAISKPPVPVDPGMVQTPPGDAAQDKGAIEPPAPGTRPGEGSGAALPEKRLQPNAHESGKRPSKRDDCRGNAALCRQDSAR